MSFESLLPTRWNRPRFPRWTTNEFDAIEELHRDVERLFGDFARTSSWPQSDLTRGLSSEWPSIDVEETDGQIIVTGDLPGFDEKQINVELADDTLTITAERKEEKEEQKANYLRRERRLGSIYRAIPLPCEVDADKVEAEFRRGVLTVKMQKSAAVKENTRHIEVKHAA